MDAKSMKPKKVKTKNYDIVISDVRMPDGNGIELLESIVGLEGHKPKVFLVTGYADISREQAIEKGAGEMFYKPVEWEELVKEIAKQVA